MADVSVCERLKAARKARREDLPALAKRTGVREENLRAIEQGRLADLPRGIYGRAAIRSFASAFGFDPVETLAECEPLLTPVEEPISALGRLRGVRQPVMPRPVGSAGSRGAMPMAAGTPLAGSVLPDWRLLAAAALDAWVVVGLLLVVVVCAVTAMMVPIGALARSGPTFGLMGVLLATAYLVWFGGLGGRTLGEQLLGVAPGTREHAALTLRAIGCRALLAATEDARFIQELGAWTGKTTRQRFSVRSAPHPELLP